MAKEHQQLKPYKIRFENHPDYLIARVSGEKVSLEIYRQYWADIVEEVLKVSPKGLLVWEDFAETISTQDTFTLVSELCQLTQFLHLRIAFLDEHIDQLDRNKLGGMIAANRGFTCRICST